MKCPVCDSPTHILDVQPAKHHCRRRYECKQYRSHRFSTREEVIGDGASESVFTAARREAHAGNLRELNAIMDAVVRLIERSHSEMTKRGKEQ